MSDLNLTATPTAHPPVAVGLDEAATLIELKRLWVVFDTDRAANEKAARLLAKTQQERLRDFLVEAYPQALELLAPINRELLEKLIRDKMNVSPKTTDAGLLIQIAAMQIGKVKDGRTKTPARREERIGLLYRIFRDKGWKAEGLEKNIVDAGGTTKLIEEDVKSRKKKDAPAQEKQLAKAYDSPAKELMVPYDGVTATKNGKWRLALVSVHDGRLAVRQLVGKEDDSATVKAVADYAVDSLAIDVLTSSIATQSGDEVEQTTAIAA